jgi:DNA polymerase-3 subunit delta'
MAGMSWNLMGHSWAEEMLQQHIISNQVRHAYLFSGPSGVGRRSLALRFAQAINCPQPLSPGQPCGTCRICRQIENMQQADLNILQSAQAGDTLKVEQVRDLQHLLSLAPYESNYRIALLLRFEEANESAQNALLKTLEEPNPRVILLGTADDPENLLPTITSRCELLRLRPMPLDDLSAALQQARQMNEEQARLIAAVASGRPGYALRLVEDENLLADRQEAMQDCLNLLTLTRLERLLFVETLIKGKERAETKGSLRVELAYWLSFWRDVLLTSLNSATPLSNPDYQNEIRFTAAQTNANMAARIVAILEHTFVRLNNANLQVMLDNLLLQWPLLSA